MSPYEIPDPTYLGCDPEPCGDRLAAILDAALHPRPPKQKSRQDRPA